MRRNLLLLIVLLLGTFACYAQAESSGLDKALAFPGKLNKKLSEQEVQLESRLERQTDKYLRKLQRQEIRLQRKLQKQDSALAASLHLGSDSLYQSWKLTLSKDSSSLATLPTKYSGKLDSMSTAIRFLEKDPRLAALGGPQFDQLKSQYSKLGTQLNQTDHLQQLVQERKALLKEKLANLPLGNSLKKYQHQAIYYQQQLEEYKRMLQEPNQWEQKTLDILSQMPSFRKFFDKYSVLGSMFRLPGQSEGLDLPGILTGLQTRQSVITEITQRLGSPSIAQQAMASGMQAGQADLASIKDKLSKSLESGESLDMPGFVPNQQKSRSFLKRLDLGTNLQTTRSNNFFPVTSDLGISLGYKLNNRSVIGFGGSYKMGWGKDIHHIRITNEGVGVRTFLDMKINKIFWLTGGGEWNYHSRFDNLTVLKSFEQWQQSVLFGLQKKQALGKYKATASVLYDALWNKHIPKTQPILFRMGYNIR
jgi:hypothetical protein